MGAVGVAFVPDNLSDWPKIVPTDTAWMRDVAWMESLRDRYSMAPMEGMKHEHQHTQ